MPSIQAKTNAINGFQPFGGIGEVNIYVVSSSESLIKSGDMVVYTTYATVKAANSDSRVVLGVAAGMMPTGQGILGTPTLSIYDSPHQTYIVQETSSGALADTDIFKNIGLCTTSTGRGISSAPAVSSHAIGAGTASTEELLPLKILGLYPGENYTFGGGIPRKFVVGIANHVTTPITPQPTTINVKDYPYLAQGDGTTDDTASIQAAIDALPIGGGIVFFPQGRYLVSSTITVGDGTAGAASTQQNIRLLGASGEYQALGTELFWTGAAGGTVMHVQGPIDRVEIGHLSLSGNSLAATVLHITSSTLGWYHDTTCTAPQASGTALLIDCVDHVSRGGNLRNTFDRLALIAQVNGGTALDVGPTALTATSSLGTSGNVFSNIQFFYQGDVSTSNAIKLRAADNNLFLGGHVQPTTGSPTGKALNNIVSSVFFPGANSFYHTALIGDVDGSTPSQGNIYWPYTVGDGETVPTDSLAWYLTTKGNMRVRTIATATVAPTYGTTVAIDASLGQTQQISPTDGVAFTIANPTSPTSGQTMRIVLRNASGGALGAITWGSQYKLSALTNPANGFNRSIDFQWGGTSWVERSRTPADVPN